MADLMGHRICKREIRRGARCFAESENSVIKHVRRSAIFIDGARRGSGEAVPRYRCLFEWLRNDFHLNEPFGHITALARVAQNPFGFHSRRSEGVASLVDGGDHDFVRDPSELEDDDCEAVGTAALTTPAANDVAMKAILRALMCPL
jgi:hypothetical protein